MNTVFKTEKLISSDGVNRQFIFAARPLTIDDFDVRTVETKEIGVTVAHGITLKLKSAIISELITLANIEVRNGKAGPQYSSRYALGDLTDEWSPEVSEVFAVAKEVVIYRGYNSQAQKDKHLANLKDKVKAEWAERSDEITREAINGVTVELAKVASGNNGEVETYLRNIVVAQTGISVEWLVSNSASKEELLSLYSQAREQRAQIDALTKQLKATEKQIYALNRSTVESKLKQSDGERTNKLLHSFKDQEPKPSAGMLFGF